MSFFRAVTGKGKIAVKPDKIRLYVNKEELCKEYEDTLRRSTEDTELLKDLFEKLGFQRKDLKTVYFNVDTEYESYQDRDKSWKRRFKGYKYNHHMKIEFAADNKRLGQVLYALAHSSLRPEFSIEYTVADVEKCKNELLHKAIEDSIQVVDSVYEKIEDAEIWIPYGEVFKHYKSKRSDINKRVRKSLNEKEESQIEKVCFMNMCMIQDHKGNVLALDKVNDSYTGTTFPGGHVEANEIFQKSMIREVWEETGLTVEAPKLGGLYHWHKSGVHYVITLYKADKFTGELKSSEEGRVYWIPLEELKTKELATGMEHVLRILESEKVDECYMHLEADGYVGDLY